MAFAHRLKIACEFEEFLPARFDKNGWACETFGQSLLSLHARNALQRYHDDDGHPSLVRWMPDKLVWKITRDSTRIALIDAKVCQPGYEMYVIETNAIKALLIYANDLHTPAYFVFSDDNVMTPMTALEQGIHGPEPSCGSGTPYLLVPRCYGLGFDEVFT